MHKICVEFVFFPGQFIFLKEDSCQLSRIYDRIYAIFCFAALQRDTQEGMKMIELLQHGAYLVHGSEIVEDTPEAAKKLQAMLGAAAPSKEEAAKGTLSLIHI